MNENGNGFQSEKNAIRPAILTDTWLLCYYASCIRKILVGLTGESCTTTLVGPKGPEVEAILFPSVDFIEYPEIKLRLFAPKNRQLLLDKLLDYKPTVLHGFWPGDLKLLSWLSQRLDIPSVLTLWKSPGRRVLSRLREPMILAASSDPIYRNILSLCPDFEPRVTCISTGVFVEDSPVCFDNPDQTTGVVVCEELTNPHDFEPLLRAVRHLLADGFEFSLAIMGQGSAERAIRIQIRDLGLAYVVTLVPPMHPVRPILQGMDIFIHIKDRKRCNLALMEAMAVGLTVAGCADSTTGLMQHEKNALLFDPTEEVGIYTSLKQLLSNHEQARVLARNARQCLQTNHSVSQMVNGYLKAYTDALKNQHEMPGD